MSYKEFITKLNNKEIKNAILLHGEENYLLDKAIKDLTESVCPIMPELNCTIFEGADIRLADIATTCESYPMMDEKRLVIVKNPIKTDMENYENVLKGLAEHTILLQVIYMDLEALGKRRREVKKNSIEEKSLNAMKDFANNGDVFAIDRITKEELGKWIKKVAAANNKTLDNKALISFIENTGYIDKNTQITLYNIENELQKLIAYTGDFTEILWEDVQKLSTQNIENDIFKLIRACQMKNTKEAIKAYDELVFWGQNAMQILSILTKQIKYMYFAKELIAKAEDHKSLAKKVGIHEYPASQAMNYSKKIDKNKISKALDDCIKAELNIKTGKLSDRLAMELLLAELFT